LQCRVLNEAHAKETDEDLKRAYTLAIHTNLMQECEHVAAWLLAFRKFAEKKIPLVETLLQYSPGQAKLEDTLIGVTSPDKLLSVFGIVPEKFVPALMPKHRFEERLFDIWKGLVHYAQQQKARLPLYNKSKHGMMYFSSPKVINTEAHDQGPVAIFTQ